MGWLAAKSDASRRREPTASYAERNEAVAESYTYLPDLASQEIPADGILSRTVHQDAHVKAVIFAFAAGQELSEHTASMPAILHILRGDVTLGLGDDVVEAHAGAWVHMPAQLRHSVRATTPVVMLLLLLKGQPS
jgi:quercetin dioxygenase-like cupin family protein